MADINGKNLCIFCFSELKEGASTCECCQKSQEDIVPSMFLPVGTVLQEKYHIGRVLGHNEFIVTYAAYDVSADRKVVAKEFFPKPISQRTCGEKEITLKKEEDAAVYKEGSEAVYNEARTIALFSENPNIIDIYDMFYENNTSYYITEFSVGETVEQYVQRKGGKITIEDCFDTLEPLCGTLAVMHDQNLCHRNIAPDNIILTQDGNIKLLGFGIARQQIAEALGDRTMGLLPGYAAPEQYQRKGKIGSWTDIYSLVATCYYCVTGAVPVSAPERVEGAEIKKTTVYGVVLKASFDELLKNGMALAVKERNSYAPDIKNMLRKCAQDGMGKESSIKKEKEPKLKAPKPPKPVKAQKVKGQGLFQDKKKLAIAGAAIVVLVGGVIFLTRPSGTEETPVSTEVAVENPTETPEENGKKENKENKKKVSYVKFADKQVEKAVAKKLGIKAGKVTEKDLKKVKELSFKKVSIQSFKDMEKMPGLKSLTISQCRLKKLDGIVKLASLKTLVLENDSLEDISVLAGMENLTSLSLADNNISDVSPLKKLKQLKSLDLSKNKILDASSLDGLKDTKVNLENQKVQPPKEETPEPEAPAQNQEPVQQAPAATPAPAPAPKPAAPSQPEEEAERVLW